MRLIDAEELLKILQEQQKLGNVNDSRGRAKAILEVIHAPTVDAEPVKHAHWECGCICSECESVNGERGTDYCPHCGARMDGDTK